MSSKRKRLGDLLIEAGIISEHQLDSALHTKKEGQKLGDALLENEYITEDQLIEVLEFQLGIPHVSLFRYPIDSNIVQLVPKDYAQKNLVIPLAIEEDRLTVAMNDPMDYFAIEHLQMSTGYRISTVIATKDDIKEAINKYYRLQEAMEDTTFEDLDEDNVDEGDDAPVIRLVNQLFLSAVQQRASDIHFDPQETKVVVRFRVDGVLRTEKVLPKKIQSVIIARIKIIANLNITENRLPQDGRSKITVEQAPVDLRISTLPTVFGEKVVIRILDLSNSITNLSQLGFNKVNYERFQKLIKQPSGIILITGPTGSGKSSTLYAALSELNNEKDNIITIEDPVEYQLEGVNQVQVNSRVGLTFATGLRSILRQDPNIVMVGEIRDSETAEIAIRASLTGHLVLSTLHTNSAIATIPRLIDMGIEPFLVVSSLSGIAAQRLVRQICPTCKEEYEPSEMERDLYEKRGIKVDRIFRGKGCNACQDTGYRGRVALHEILVIDDEIRQLMMNQKSMSTIREYALRNGMIFLIDDGLLKAKKGITSVQEVLRVALDE